MVRATCDGSYYLEPPDAEFDANDNDPKDSKAMQKKIIPVPKRYDEAGVQPTYRLSHKTNM
jgi:hypothetical protein